MIRITVQSDDAGMAANCGGHVLTTVKTFSIESTDMEVHLKDQGGYIHRQIIGYELVEKEPPRC